MYSLKVWIRRRPSTISLIYSLDGERASGDNFINSTQIQFVNEKRHRNMWHILYFEFDPTLTFAILFSFFFFFRINSDMKFCTFCFVRLADKIWNHYVLLKILMIIESSIFCVCPWFFALNVLCCLLLLENSGFFWL